jgi:hypothetical protein
MASWDSMTASGTAQPTSTRYAQGQELTTLGGTLGELLKVKAPDAPVRDVLDGCEKTTEMLLGNLRLLEDRLRPILRPVSTAERHDPINDPQTVGSDIPMVAELLVLGRNLDTLQSALLSILARLAL